MNRKKTLLAFAWKCVAFGASGSVVGLLGAASARRPRRVMAPKPPAARDSSSRRVRVAQEQGSADIGAPPHQSTKINSLRVSQVRAQLAQAWAGCLSAG